MSTPQKPAPPLLTSPEPGPSGASRRFPNWGVWGLFIASFAVTLAILMSHHVPPVAPAPTANPPVGVGDPAPDFSLRDSLKEPADPPIALASLLDHGPVIIIFISNLNCPPCMQHLADIARHYDQFTNAGLQVVAIGPDPPGQSSRDAIVAFGSFPFPLLSDPENKTATAYGLASPAVGFLEGTFIVDKSNRIVYVKTAGDPVGEVPELLSAGKAATRTP